MDRRQAEFAQSAGILWINGAWRKYRRIHELGKQLKRAITSKSWLRAKSRVARTNHPRVHRGPFYNSAPPVIGMAIMA
jgi:hypothetical protein